MHAFRSPDRAPTALGLGSHAPAHTTVREMARPFSLSLLGKPSTPSGACCSAGRRRLDLPLRSLRAVVTVAALAWLVPRGCSPALGPAESRPATGAPQLSRGSVGGRGGPERGQGDALPPSPYFRLGCMWVMCARNDTAGRGELSDAPSVALRPCVVMATRRRCATLLRDWGVCLAAPFAARGCFACGGPCVAFGLGGRVAGWRMLRFVRSS